MERPRAFSRRYTLAAAASILIGIALTSAAHAQDTESGGPRWVATWSAPPMAPGSQLGGAGSRSFDNQTVRQILHISAGGFRVRVRLSNQYGAAPLIIGSAHIAVQSTNASIVPGTGRSLTFNGRSSTVIAPGDDVLSDSVQLVVLSNTNLALSLYLPQNTGLATYHHNGNQTAYISGPGDFSDSIDFPSEATATERYFVSFVEVLPVTRIGAFAVIGDSISEGATTTLDANNRVTDVLSRRFNPRLGIPRLAMLNQATGCGRLVFDVCGPNGLSRFERDVLDAKGISHVLIAFGVADIIFSTALGIPEQDVSVEELIAGTRELGRQARARGIKVYIATITPWGGTTFPNVDIPENEAKRQAYNQWVRTNREFNNVIDYDKAVRDPSQPGRLLPEYAFVDNLHLNDAGHEAIARAIARALQ